MDGKQLEQKYKTLFGEPNKEAGIALVRLNDAIKGKIIKNLKEYSLEDALEVAEKEDVHGKAAQFIRILQSIHKFYKWPTKENGELALEEMQIYEHFEPIVNDWANLSKAMYQLREEELCRQLDGILSQAIPSQKTLFDKINEIYLKHPMPEVREYSLTKLADWQKRTNA